MSKMPRQKFLPIDDVTVENVDKLFSFVMIGGKMRVVRRVPSAADEDGEALTLEFMSPDEFKKAFVNKTKKIVVTVRGNQDDPDDDNMDFDVPVKKLLTTKTIKKTIAEYHMMNPRRVTYDRLVFQADPDKVRPTDYNMWNGFSVRPIKGNWRLMDNMILDSLANNDPEVWLYIKKWCAWKLQNPTRRTEAAMVFRSDKQGTGKGLLGNGMCRFFGSHAVHLYRADSLTARFNSQLAMCAFLFDDESTYSGDKKSASAAKGLITESTIDIEKKGVDVITLPNALGIIKATNSKWAVPAESGDRRYAIFETSNEMANDQAYFRPIIDQLKGDGGAGYSAMLYDLLRMDLGDWHPRADIPQTAASADQKTLSLAAEDQWLLGFLESGVLPHTNPKWPNRVTSPSSLYAEARRNSPSLRFWSDVQFARYLDEWGIPAKSSHGIYRDFGPLMALRARWMDRFPWYQGFANSGEWTDERSEHEDLPDAMDLDFG